MLPHTTNGCVPFISANLNALEHLAHRGYTGGFYQRRAHADYQNYASGQSEGGISQYVGDISAYDPASGIAEIVVKNRFRVGDCLEIVSPAGNQTLTLARMENVEGEEISEALGSGWIVRIPLPLGLNPERAMLVRFV